MKPAHRLLPLALLIGLAACSGQSPGDVQNLPQGDAYGAQQHMPQNMPRATPQYLSQDFHQAMHQSIRQGMPAGGGPAAHAPASQQYHSGNQHGGPAQAGFQRFTLNDVNGFERPIPAFTVEIPAGWHTQGQVSWNSGNCNGPDPHPQLLSRSPDGLHMLEVLPIWASIIPDPTIGEMSTLAPGCPQAPFTTIRQYLEHLAKQRHPHGRVLDYRERPDILPSQRLPSFMPGAGVQFRNWMEGGEILVAWEEQGYSMRESIMVYGTFTESTMELPMTGRHRGLTLVTASPMTMRAPDGQLDLAKFDYIRRSIQVDSLWANRMQQHYQAINQTNAKAQAQRSGNIANTNAEIARMRDKAWAENQQAQDARHKRYMDGVVNNVQSYHTPSGGTVELSNHYDNAWRLQDGSYLQTNDPNFNPYLQLGVEGQQLDPVDY